MVAREHMITDYKTEELLGALLFCSKPTRIFPVSPGDGRPARLRALLPPPGGQRTVRYLRNL